MVGWLSLLSGDEGIGREGMMLVVEPDDRSGGMEKDGIERDELAL